MSRIINSRVTQERSHADLTDYTEDSCLAGNINLTQNTQNSRNNISEQDNQRELDTITQNTHCFARVGHPDGDSKHYTLNKNFRTQNTQNSQKASRYALADCSAVTITLTITKTFAQGSQPTDTKVSASERNASALAISQRAQPKLNNKIVKL